MFLRMYWFRCLFAGVFIAAAGVIFTLFTLQELSDDGSLQYGIAFLVMMIAGGVCMVNGFLGVSIQQAIRASSGEYTVNEWADD